VQSFKIAIIYYTLVCALILAAYLLVAFFFFPKSQPHAISPNLAPMTTSPSTSPLRFIVNGAAFARKFFTHFFLEIVYDPPTTSSILMQPPNSSTHINTPQPHPEYALFEDFLYSNNFQLTSIPVAIGIWGIVFNASFFICFHFIFFSILLRPFLSFHICFRSYLAQCLHMLTTRSSQSVCDCDAHWDNCRSGDDLSPRMQ
jgi:hypothetical protein